VAQHVALIVPVRGFDDAKSRLSSVLNPAQRRALAQNCARGVLTRTASCSRFVVCDNDEVAQWALSCDAAPIRVTSQGLNASLTESIPLISSRSPIDLFLISHADLPLSGPLDHIIEGLIIESVHSDEHETAIIMCPDRHLDGTNVLGIPASLINNWTFQYGQGSFARHLQQAKATGLPIRVIEDPDIGLDLDTPDDLQHPDLINILPTLIPDWTHP
jgi:2-phospho-L-lactate guanylyltransferase